VSRLALDGNGTAIGNSAKVTTAVAMRRATVFAAVVNWVRSVIVGLADQRNMTLAGSLCTGSVSSILYVSVLILPEASSIGLLMGDLAFLSRF
jgi:hypothetical protein